MLVVTRRQRPTADELEVWRRLLVVHSRAVQRLDRSLRAAHGLPLEWYDVLVQVHEAGGRASMGALAEATLISASNCTRLVDRMVAAGLLTRAVDPDDARVKHAVLSPAGRAMLRRAARTHLDDVHHHVTSKLVGDRPAAVRSFLDDVLASFAAPAVPDGGEQRPGQSRRAPG